ncbi:hypothetical protein E2C01_093882 [Portunus trituberculatus]|uniref:Uncharacterized protein n=1 Tax=Portunus trituberculatus TaxID=210409 RepID=A0A5B7JUP0_PORTR|nr:hypothetical protein [Portunus trituberculatus]
MMPEGEEGKEERRVERREEGRRGSHTTHYPLDKPSQAKPSQGKQSQTEGSTKQANGEGLSCLPDGNTLGGNKEFLGKDLRMREPVWFVIHGVFISVSKSRRRGGLRGGRLEEFTREKRRMRVREGTKAIVSGIKV